MTSLSERLDALTPVERRRLAADWVVMAHAGQRAPQGDWRTWLMLGGRGAGKTRAGAEWVADRAREAGRIALVGQSLHDVREVMIEGPSGLCALPRYGFGGRPRWEALEEELMGLGGEDGDSPDRADALVWAVTDLLVHKAGLGPRIRQL